MQQSIVKFIALSYRYCSTCFGHYTAHHQEPVKLPLQPVVSVWMWRWKCSQPWLRTLPHCLQICFSKNSYPALPSGWASSFTPPDPSVSPLWFLFKRACSCKGSNSLELNFDAALFLSGTPSVTQAGKCKQSSWCMKHQNLTPSLLSIFQVNSSCSEVYALLTNRFLYWGTT